MAGMFCQGETSQTGANRNFYQGESSNTGAQRGFQSNGFGFVGHSQRSNGNGSTGGHFSQGSIPHQFHSNRSNGGFNGQRYHSRPRFNGGNGTTNRGNGGFSGNGSFSGNNQFHSKEGSNWNHWNGYSGQKSGIIPECQICNKRGHTAPNYYYRNEQQPVQPHSIPKCQICGKRGHVALNCFHRSNYAYQGAPLPPTLTAMTAQSTPEFNADQAWIMDIGATHHMTGQASDLDMLTPFEGDQKITVGNGECLPVKNTGQGNKGNLNERKE
ncbi:uncharacterized protein LOC126630449 [Malus sylvestris]|uniref:uncharacterized protein LOC126630449 n=1 Tax=Malus sylvestris TaxID=3752 RepID=UPI0021ACAEFC|nr:uncharacterized protein LOC126630449 [Malus sylvestris]